MSASQSRPPNCGCTLMPRDRVCSPQPHVLVHAVHSSHAVWEQWIGHLHGSSCVRACASQSLPPCAPSLIATRLRVRTHPRPADRSGAQGFHVPNEPHRQCTGHGRFALHARASLRAGQPFPPCAGMRAIVRLRCCTPWPHVAEQVPQLSHSVAKQSVGHTSMYWQSCVWRVAPHDRPPALACVDTTRVRYCVPGPHVLVQGLHALQDASAQWVGQGACTQSCC